MVSTGHPTEEVLTHGPKFGDHSPIAVDMTQGLQRQSLVKAAPSTERGQAPLPLSHGKDCWGRGWYQPTEAKGEAARKAKGESEGRGWERQGRKEGEPG